MASTTKTEAAEFITRTAGADLSAETNRYKFVEPGAAGVVTVANAGTDQLLGVLCSLDVAGKPVKVAISGIVPVVAGAAVAVGANVTSDASGRAITAVTTNKVRGMALDAAAAAGDIIRVALIGGNQILA